MSTRAAHMDFLFIASAHVFLAALSHKIVVNL